MPRIIAGIAGGIQLKTAAGQRSLRPTTDRVKEALFARLDAIDMIKNSVVLDLCAGSGALALEAISRGAQSADLVENNNVNYRFLQENITKVKAIFHKTGNTAEGLPMVQGHPIAALRFLQQADESKKWDLVFLDPPYAMANEEITRYLGLLSKYLVADGLIIVERSARDQWFSVPRMFSVYDAKTYGDVALYWLEFEKQRNFIS